eukprot:scaffold169037_cov18-Tisochrysis_lutea.AAC.1
MSTKHQSKLGCFMSVETNFSKGLQSVGGAEDPAQTAQNGMEGDLSSYSYKKQRPPLHAAATR